MEPSLDIERRPRATIPAPATARSFWISAPGRGEIRSAPLAPMNDGEVLVETLYSAISRGTESLVFQGRVPPGQASVMRCPFQEGDFPAPVKYGYQTVGRIVDGPQTLVGRMAFFLHPHQDRFAVPASAATLLPDGVPAARAVLAANLETALNGLWDGDVRAGDRVAVIGAGVVGLLTAWLAARIPATEVVVVDVDPAKAAPAAALGLAFCCEPGGLAPFDVVFHASGNPAGLMTALSLADREATIVELSWFGETAVSLPLGDHFHSGRLTIRSSQVGGIGHPRRHRWPHHRRLATAVGLLADDRLDHLISGESPFEALPETMAAVAGGRLPALCHRLRYNG